MERVNENINERFNKLVKSGKEWEKSDLIHKYPIPAVVYYSESMSFGDNIQTSEIIKDNISKRDNLYILPNTFREISVGCSSILPLPESIKNRLYNFIDPDRTVDFEFVRKRAVFGAIGVVFIAGVGIGIPAITNYVSSLSK